MSETVAAIRRVGLAMRGRFQRRLAEHALTFPQWLLLKALQEEGRLTSREAAARLGVTAANVTGIVDRLERDRFVTRSKSPDDGRVTFLRLTERGHEKLDAIRAAPGSVVGDMFEDLTEAELAKLRALLAKVRLTAEDEANCPP